MIVRIFGMLFTAAFIVGVCVAAGIGYFLWTMSEDLPDYEVLADYEPPVMTRIHAADGRLLAEYARERRLYLPIESIPEHVVKAVMAAEDKNFYKHSGIDVTGIVRAVVVYVRSGGTVVQGASTITQQVAKNFLLTNERTINRKVREALLSLRIERSFEKDEILELYLNEIYLGLGSYGVAAASLVYFDKSVHELTIGEAAYFAALPKAPNNYHPFRYPERAIERRNWVLDRMIENGYITAEVGEAAKSEAIQVTPRQVGSHIFAADYFAEEVRREISDRYGSKALYDGGLSVRTTLDPNLQRLAHKALRSGLEEFDRQEGWRGPVGSIEFGDDWGVVLNEVEALDDIAPWRMGVVLSVTDEAATVGLRPENLPSGGLSPERETVNVPLENLEWARWAEGDRRGRAISKPSDVINVGEVAYFTPDPDGDNDWSLRQIPKVSGALVAMDPHTGRVKALVGGFSYDESEFNRATQARRQPGSSFKPIVYAAALDNGYTPSSVVMDAPITIDQGGGLGTWTPQNYTKKFYGPSSLRRGIEQSRNVMTVRLARDMGMPLVAEYAKRFGVYDELLPVLSMSLGAGETTVLRLTAAYSIMANGGRKIEPTLIDRVQDRYGRTVFKHDPRICEACNADWQQQAEPPLIDGRARILDGYTAYQITSMMEGVVERGTAKVLQKLERPIAGKTGTTNDYKDAWFIGYSTDLAVGIYVGFDNPRSMGRSSTGGGLAAPIFAEFMEAALQDVPAVPFRVPDGVNLVPINVSTGLRSSGSGNGIILEAFKPGTGPPEDYSIIGFENDLGRGLSGGGAEANSAVISGTGGLY
ncbi:MAG: penicillin-binding protein 1A [Pseudomonadota bacterium]